MTKVIKNVNKLEESLREIIFSLPILSEKQKSIYLILDQAFAEEEEKTDGPYGKHISVELLKELDRALAEEEEKPWEPENNQVVYYVNLEIPEVQERTWGHDISSNGVLQMNLVYPNRRLAQQFLEDYKTFLSERVKNR